MYFEHLVIAYDVCRCVIAYIVVILLTTYHLMFIFIYVATPRRRLESLSAASERGRPSNIETQLHIYFPYTTYKHMLESQSAAIERGRPSNI